jgi:class 3 adenylate cyclase/DNA-binding response OmpR family regulator
MRGTVLLVEDDALFRETVRDTLNAAGYETLEAADGVEALDRTRDEHPDLVLLDFDLPRMMGDETLERMLQMRPGLVCYVLSGKDDLHQALLMGRRGAYGWIDKYIGADRLLALVDQGLKTRPCGLDLTRLVATSYPQPVAVPYLKWRRMETTAPAVERLITLRELFEALVEYLGATAVAVYLNRGLLEDEANAAILPLLEKPAPHTWLAALAVLLPRFDAQRRWGWWHELARVLQRPVSQADGIADAVKVVSGHASMPSDSTARSLLDLFTSLAAFHEVWLTPHLLPPADLDALLGPIARALELSVAELSRLADVELCWVGQAAMTASGDYLIGLDSLAGQNIHSRLRTSATPLRQGDLYLVSRVTREPIASLDPLMIYGRCEVAGPVSHGIFTLAHVVPNRRVMYRSHACGHLRWLDSPTIVESLRHLYFKLNPRGARSSHLLRNVAVGLFDMSGYTPLTRQQGPDVARELVRRMVAAVRESAQLHGGVVGEPVGDEVLAYFNDASSALRAAVETMRTLQRLNANNPQAVHVHVGMDYGPGIVESRDVWGDVINRAKRCQTAAGPDEIVISSEMASALGDSPLVPLRKLQQELKGFGPAELFKVLWQSSETTSPPFAKASKGSRTA